MKTDNTEDVKTFISHLNPQQVHTALEYYMQRSSPFEEMTFIGDTIVAFTEDAGINEKDKAALAELEEKWKFWKSIC